MGWTLFLEITCGQIPGRPQEIRNNRNGYQEQKKLLCDCDVTVTCSLITSTTMPSLVAIDNVEVQI